MLDVLCSHYLELLSKPAPSEGQSRLWTMMVVQHSQVLLPTAQDRPGPTGASLNRFLTQGLYQGRHKDFLVIRVASDRRAKAAHFYRVLSCLAGQMWCGGRVSVTAELVLMVGGSVRFLSQVWFQNRRAKFRRNERAMLASKNASLLKSYSGDVTAVEQPIVPRPAPRPTDYLSWGTASPYR